MRIALLATGGTIASRRAEGGHLVVGLDAEALLSQVSLPRDVEVDAVQFSSKPSFALSPDDMLALVREVRTRLASDSEGVVITHGTDTLEEAAFLLAQYLPRDARVVLTGAQRSADEADSDGPRNLRDALRTVCSPSSLGPCVVAGGVAIAAGEARKVHTSSLRAFSGSEAGALAVVDEDGVHPRTSATRGGYCCTWPLPAALPRVDLVKLAAGSDGTHVLASLAADARGIVVESFGSGNATEAVVEAVGQAVRSGVSVVITSRAGNGRVRSLYGDSGGGASLAKAGAVFASDLTGPQARIALAVLLAADRPREIQWDITAIADGVPV